MELQDIKSFDPGDIGSKAIVDLTADAVGGTVRVKARQTFLQGSKDARTDCDWFDLSKPMY